MRQILISIFLIFSSASTFASSLDGKIASFNDLHQLLLSGELTPIDATTVGNAPAYYAINGFISANKIKFEFLRATDEKWDKRYLDNGAPLVVKKGIAFSECDFSEIFWFMFRNTTFEECISFVQTTNIRMVFKDCTFKGPFLLRVGTKAQFLRFVNCTFERGFGIMEGATIDEYLSFENCTFKYNEDLIENPRVHKDQFNIGQLKECPHYFYFAYNQQEIDCEFKNCRFEKAVNSHPSFVPYIDLSHSSFKSLEFTDCKIDVPMDLSFVSVSNQFKIYNSTLNQVAAEAINFNSTNSKIDWDNFKDQKLRVLKDEKEFLNGKDVIKLDNKYYFETLISVYTLFYHTYKDQGNTLSANACYVEWKNIETAYLRNRLEGKFTSRTWFSWFMNAFLKTFCDYGTNPFKSLMWSLIVMLAFTGIFMIYLWNFDTSEHKDIRRVFKNFGLYFVGGKSLLEIGKMMVPEKSIQNSAEDLRTFIYGHKKGLPWYYKIIGLKLARPKFSFRSMFFYKAAHRVLGIWDNANKMKKLWVAFVVSLWIIGILLKILLIRVFDAFTMSLNSFSTLGYGDLPRSEGMRYLSIIEGFIGWFLLSIFSVSLISQIIQ